MYWLGDIASTERKCGDTPKGDYTYSTPPEMVHLCKSRLDYDSVKAESIVPSAVMCVEVVSGMSILSKDSASAGR